MKRPKSLPSRRQRALRRGVVLAVFLLAFLAIHRPSITPGQVIRASENLLGLERTEVLAQAEVLSHRVTFSANQDALLLTVYQPLHPLSYSMGWNNAQPLGVLSAPTEAAPVTLSVLPFWDSDAQETLILAFGQTVLEGACKVRIYNHTGVWNYSPDVFLEGALFSSATGDGYLFLYQPSPTEDVFLPAWYQVLDREDRVLYTGSLPKTLTPASFD